MDKKRRAASDDAPPVLELLTDFLWMSLGLALCAFLPPPEAKSGKSKIHFPARPRAYFGIFYAICPFDK